MILPRRKTMQYWRDSHVPFTSIACDIHSIIAYSEPRHATTHHNHLITALLLYDGRCWRWHCARLATAGASPPFGRSCLAWPPATPFHHACIPITPHTPHTLAISRHLTKIMTTSRFSLGTLFHIRLAPTTRAFYDRGTTFNCPRSLHRDRPFTNHIPLTNSDH
ncbi:uncharacterized protein K489DRAFT_63567 [Dissoconium aciculare CBS 342.82]|uniref:Uncharacterized protein n=1 Tax=Dissoconium aciculare CBS 342.82 TaxID=1314786 RepID=A0A6J3LZC6_9PEZI|nr:uncharacterized protein K489DRAFT_63567 [Dissoconium aciculare CBS 342.82]KAF1819992.1 hypothetical protein K489DRAFT_63567 [Dissoconium aciculare CBS 342.82]